MVRRFTSHFGLVSSSRSSVQDALALAPVDPLLANPVAKRLLDDAELTSDAGDTSVLVDDQGCRVTTELSRVAPSPAGRRWLIFGHC